MEQISRQIKLNLVFNTDCYLKNKKIERRTITKFRYGNPVDIEMIFYNGYEISQKLFYILRENIFYPFC